MMEEGWSGSDGDSYLEDVEKLYSENVYQKGIHRGGKEMWVWWRLEKQPEGKYSGYFKNFLDIDIHCVYIQKVEAVIQGKKANVEKGEIEMFFRPRIELDYNKQWDSNWFLRHMKPIYEKRLIHQEIEKREKELWRDSYRIHAKIKQYLQLKSFVAVPEPFFARTYGYSDE